MYNSDNNNKNNEKNVSPITRRRRIINPPQHDYEEKTKETLSQIRAESKVEDEGHAMSRQDDEEIDSDDDMEAYRMQQAMAATDMRALDSTGFPSLTSNFFLFLVVLRLHVHFVLFYTIFDVIALINK